MKTKIAIIGYKDFIEKSENVIRLIENIEIQVYSGFGDDSIQIARELEEQGVDVIITGQANYSYLKERINIPIIILKVTFVDIINALNEASKYKPASLAIAFSSFDNLDFNLDSISKLINVDIYKLTYLSANELEEKIIGIKEQGIKTVIGSTLAVSLAEKYNLNGIYIYSVENTVIRSIERAIEISRINKETKRKEIRENIILNYAYEGIITINSNGNIFIFNDSASKILKIPQKGIIGEHIDAILSQLNLTKILNTGIAEINEIITINSVQITINKIPLKINNEVVGVVATFQDITNIEELENLVRRKKKFSGFSAKYTFDNIKGKKKKILEIIDIAKKYAKNDSPVLIQGETGTGKELFAQSIHNYSKRRNYPFVAINCASVPENLLESELFGYKAGAFTGANKEGKKGLFEIAHKGTLFLDEINSIPKIFQTKLLRVLEEGEIIQVGGMKIIPVDVRIITSSNINLKSAVKEGTIRKDLYYRIGVLKLNIPPLRERKSDLPILINDLAKEINPYLYRKLDFVFEKITSKLLNYNFPGNIRELKCFLERFMILVDENNINNNLYIHSLIKTCLDETIEENIDFDYETSNVQNVLEKTEKQMFLNLLEKYESKTELARHLGIGRTTLYRKLKNLGIDY